MSNPRGRPPSQRSSAGYRQPPLSASYPEPAASSTPHHSFRQPTGYQQPHGQATEYQQPHGQATGYQQPHGQAAGYQQPHGQYTPSTSSQSQGYSETPEQNQQQAGSTGQSSFTQVDSPPVSAVQLPTTQHAGYARQSSRASLPPHNQNYQSHVSQSPRPPVMSVPGPRDTSTPPYPQITLTPAPRTEKSQHPVHTWYPGRWSLVIGIGQIVAGLMSIVFQSLAIYAHTKNREDLTENKFYSAGMGIWIGVAFIITGCAGLVAAIGKRFKQIIVFMVMSTVVLSTLNILYIAWMCLAIASAANNRLYECHDKKSDDVWEPWICYQNPLQLGALSMCLISGVMYGAFAIWALFITSNATCCRSEKEDYTKSHASLNLTASDINRYYNPKPQLLHPSRTTEQYGDVNIAENQMTGIHQTQLRQPTDTASEREDAGYHQGNQQQPYTLNNAHNQQYQNTQYNQTNASDEAYHAQPTQEYTSAEGQLAYSPNGQDYVTGEYHTAGEHEGYTTEGYPQTGIDINNYPDFPLAESSDYSYDVTGHDPDYLVQQSSYLSNVPEESSISSHGGRDQVVENRENQRTGNMRHPVPTSLAENQRTGNMRHPVPTSLAENQRTGNMRHPVPTALAENQRTGNMRHPVPTAIRFSQPQADEAEHHTVV